MKKVLIIILLSLLIGCTKNINKEENLYNKYVNELKNIETSSENIPFEINFSIEEINEDFLSYTVLLDRKGILMNNIESILIHDKVSENAFPSIGILDSKITLDKDNTKKGIKLTGYIEKQNDITFKFMIKYISEENKEEKYFYIYNYRQ